MRIINRIMILAMLAAPHIADASHCHEISGVVGYQRCTRFGWWSPIATEWWEAGLVGLEFDPKLIDATASFTNTDGTSTRYHVTAAPNDPRPVTAMGFRTGARLQLGRSYYLGNEFDMARVTGGPRLFADVAERGTSSMMTTAMDGFVAQGKVVFGRHAALGPLTVAGELTSGGRIATFHTADLPDAVHAAVQGWFLVEARAKVDAWLSPSWSVGVSGSTDVLRTGDYAVAITLGLHLLPFDAMR